MISFQKVLRKSQTTSNFIRKVWMVLTPIEKVRLVKAAAVLSISNFLDLAGIFLIGILSVVGLSQTGLGGLDPEGTISRFLQIVKLDGYSTDIQVSFLAFWAVVVFVFRTIFSMYYVRKTYVYLGKVAARITEFLIARDFNQSLDKILRENSQKQLYRNIYGVDSLVFGIIASSITIFSDSMLLIVIGVSLFALNVQVTLLTFVYLTIVAICLNKILSPKSYLLGLNRSALSIKLSKLYMNTISSFREISVQNRKNFIFSEISKVRYAQTQTLSQIAFLPMVGKYVIEGTFIFGVMLLSFYQFILADPKNSVGTLAVFLAAGSRIAPAILRIQNGLLSLRNSVGSSEVTLIALGGDSNFNLPKMLPSDANISITDAFKPTVECIDLSFSYSGETLKVIDKLSFSLEPGDFLAIIGPSGIGKSTLVDLMLGLMPPTSGEVRISGLPPFIATQVWEGQIAYVPQEVSIFDGTVDENLSFSFPEGTFSARQMFDSLGFVGLDTFVLNKADALKFQVGENGNNLSGGQRQRLGLARALITRPSILFLDEVTSALDAESENAINSSLRKILEKSTIISIAHKISTLELATKILCMSEDNVELYSSLDQFISAQPKLYANMKFSQKDE